MLPFSSARTLRSPGPLRVVNGSFPYSRNPGRASLGRAWLGGWAIDVVRDIKSDDLAKLQDGVLQAQQSANEAFDLLNSFEQEFDAVEARKREVQTLPMEEVQIVAPSLHASDDIFRRMARNMAAIDVIFLELGQAFASMATSLQQAGFEDEARRIRLVTPILANWRIEAERRLYPRVDAALDDRDAIEKDFFERLRSRGLRHLVDNDKPEYWAALDEAVSTATGIPFEASLSGSRLGAAFITPAIAKIIVTVIIVGGALSAIALLRSNQDAAKQATDKAFGLIDDFRQKDALRQQQVQKGEKSQAAADAERLADAAAAAATAKAAADVIKATSSSTAPTIESTLQSVFFWGVLPLAGGLILLRVLKII